MVKAKETAWQPLIPGDGVAVVNACMIDGDRAVHAGQYQQLLIGWGYKVNGLEKFQEAKPYRLWAADPKFRAQMVIDAIEDPKNKAIFLLVAGDGANETMKLVADWHNSEIAAGREGLPKRGIPVVGLSNNTTLLNPLAQMGIISPIQGKLDAAFPSNPKDERQIVVVEGNAQALRDLLSGKAQQLEFPVQPINKAAAEYKGEATPIEIVGGCNFHVIESARSPFQVETKGKYLALEGPDEQCSVKETLQGLKREGMLEGVKGIFLGHIAGYENKAKQSEVAAAAAELNIPVFVGIPWGHISPGEKKDVYLPLHTESTFAIDKDGKPTLIVDVYRTRENLDQAYDTYNKRPAFVPQVGSKIAGNPVIVGMETMLQDKNHPDLAGHDVVLAFTPKFGEPISHMMGVSQSLSALLQKGNLAGIKSITLDLSGLYDDKDKPLYRNLKGDALDPPPSHRYNDEAITAVIPDRAAYEREITAYLQNFSERYLGGIPVAVGFNKVAGLIAEQQGTPVTELTAAYKHEDGTGRCNASAMAYDYNNGAGKNIVQQRVLMNAAQSLRIPTVEGPDGLRHSHVSALQQQKKTVSSQQK